MIISDLLNALENGSLQIVEKKSGNWELNHEIFKKINSIFSAEKQVTEIDGLVKWADKVPLKSNELSDEELLSKTYRLVPGSWVRCGSYIGEKVVVMTNSFVNVGAYIDDGSMIDSGVTIGSCARIGRNCHVSSNVVIAGVLEPSAHYPVIIEDSVFVGAQSLIAEGVLIPEGCVIGAGVKITSSTKIFDSEGNIIEKLEPYSVVIPGSYARGNVFVDCAIVIKKVDEKTRFKTSINELLR